MATKEVKAGRAIVEVSLRDRIGKGLNAIERRLSSFGRSVATFGAALTAGGVGLIGWPGKLAAEMEQTRVAFRVLIGDATKANALLAEMETFAANTPFGFSDVAEAGKLLLNYGIKAHDILPMLNMLGDVSLGNAERLHLLALAFGQVVSRGKLTGDNLKQLTENGFNPLQQMAEDLAKQFGGLAERYMPALVEKMEAGQISVAAVTRAFYSATSAGGRFFNSMNEQSKTGLGMLSKLFEVISYAAVDFGTIVLDMLKPAIALAIEFAETLRSIIKANAGFAKILAKVAIAVVVVGAVLTAAGVAALGASLIFGGLAKIWGLLVGSIAFIFSPLGIVVTLLIAAGVAAYHFRDAIGSALSSIAAFFAPAIEAIGRVWDVFSTTWNGILGALLGGQLTEAAGIAWLGFVAMAWTAVAELGNVMQAALSFLEAWIPGVASVRDSVVRMFAGIGNAILAGRWDLAGAILMAKLQAAIASGWGGISNFWAAAMTGIGSIWDMALYGFRTAWNTTSTALATGMVWLVGKFQFVIAWAVSAFDTLVTSAKVAVNAIHGFVTNTSDEATHLNAGINAALAKRTRGRFQKVYDDEKLMHAGVKQQGQQAQAGIRSDMEQSMVGRVQSEQATRDANAAHVAGLRAKVADLEKQAAAAAGNSTLADRASAANDELKKAIAAATAERNKKPEAPGTPRGLPGLAMNAGQQLAKVESRGTFSAAAALTFGGGRDAAQTTARNTGTLVKLTQRVLDKPAPAFT